jgi:hypothetical protein
VTLLGETLLDNDLFVGPDGCLVLGGWGQSPVIALARAAGSAGTVTLTVPLAGPGTYVVCIHATGRPSACDSFEVAAPASVSSPDRSPATGGLPGWVAVAAGLTVVAAAAVAGITARRHATG